MRTLHAMTEGRRECMLLDAVARACRASARRSTGSERCMSGAAASQRLGGAREHGVVIWPNPVFNQRPAQVAQRVSKRCAECMRESLCELGIDRSRLS